MASALLFALFGLIVGSFLNVLILRHGRMSLVGRSQCLQCGRKIAWHDNIPLLSWFLLRGRCRYCGACISLQYPLVEVGTCLIFALIGGSLLPIFDRLFALPIVAFLIAIAVHDLRTTYIPDRWVYAFIALAFAYPFLTPPLPDDFDTAVFLFSGPAAAALLFSMWLVSKGRWMGFGDVKLAVGIGYLLGPVSGLLAVMLAFILGAIVSLAILLPLPSLARRLRHWGIAHFTPSQSYTMKSEVPFGPFLVAAAFILWISQMHSLDFGLMLFGLSR